MAKTDLDARRLDAARAVVDSMVAGDRAAVVDFDSDGDLLEPLTTNKGDLRRAVASIDAAGYPTNVGTGVRTALDELVDRGRTAAVRGAILIADGAGNYNPALTDEARDAGIVINTVGLGTESDVTVLREIAAGTGGQFVRVGRADQLPDVFRRLADDTGGEAGADTDEDGLSDCLETTGVLAANGRTYYTDPRDADSDDDGLTDGDEVGERIDFARLGEDLAIPALSRLAESGARVHSLRGHPKRGDSDDDGLIDATELDDGTLVFDPDSDDDGLGDGTERAAGTNPWWVNSDGDSFDDGYEYDRQGDGLKPLFYDRKVSKLSYVADFVRGFVLGDLWPKEGSTAWLAGSLTSSLIPLVDIRDILGNGIRGDWVGTGLSAVGLIPIAGDAGAVVGKITKFLASYPDRVREVAVWVSTHGKMLHPVKVDVFKAVLKPGTWDDLVAKGAGEASLIKMVTGGTDLDALADAVRRSGHVSGVNLAIQTTWKAGEEAIETLFNATQRGIDHQVWFRTRGLDVDGVKWTIGVGRFADVLSSRTRRFGRRRRATSGSTSGSRRRSGRTASSSPRSRPMRRTGISWPVGAATRSASTRASSTPWSSAASPSPSTSRTDGMSACATSIR